jgi:Cu/Ag efflux protein CusF
MVVLGGSAGVQTEGMPMSTKPAVSASKSTMPLVDAEVKKVVAAKGVIVLKHGDVPNLAMLGMMMGFDIADKKMLTRVKVGDKVKVQARVVGGKATVTELKGLGEHRTLERQKVGANRAARSRVSSGTFDERWMNRFTQFR